MSREVEKERASSFHTTFPERERVSSFQRTFRERERATDCSQGLSGEERGREKVSQIFKRVKLSISQAQVLDKESLAQILGAMGESIEQDVPGKGGEGEDLPKEEGGRTWQKRQVKMETREKRLGTQKQRLRLRPKF